MNRDQYKELFRLGMDAQTSGFSHVAMIVAAVVIQELLEERSKGMRGTVVRASLETTEEIGSSTTKAREDQIVLTFPIEPGLRLTIPVMSLQPATIVALLKGADIVKVTLRPKQQARQRAADSRICERLHAIVPMEICMRDAKEHLAKFAQDASPMTLVLLKLEDQMTDSDDDQHPVEN